MPSSVCGRFRGAARCASPGRRVGDVRLLKTPAQESPNKRIMGSLWAFKIKFIELGKFDKLNPRWCVKGYGMDKSIYVGFSEVCLTTSIKILACIPVRRVANCICTVVWLS